MIKTKKPHVVKVRGDILSEAATSFIFSLVDKMWVVFYPGVEKQDPTKGLTQFEGSGRDVRAEKHKQRRKKGCKCSVWRW